MGLEIMSAPLVEFVRSVSGRAFTIPKGTVIAQRWEKNGQPCWCRDDGAQRVDVTLEQDVTVRLLFDAGAIDDCVNKALRARGRRAKAGPVTVKVVR